jgi:hypothetical protein
MRRDVAQPVSHNLQKERGKFRMLSGICLLSGRRSGQIRCNILLRQPCFSPASERAQLLLEFDDHDDQREHRHA